MSEDESGVDVPEALHRDVRTTIEALHTCPARHLRVRIDGRDWSGSYLMLEVMNIPYVGPNLALVPGAAPDDGALNVALLTEDGRDAFERFLERYRRDGPCSPPLDTVPARHLRIVWDGSDIHADGEVWPYEEPHGLDVSGFRTSEIGIHVRPHALAFLVPS